MIKIALDAMGGDNAPVEIIEGAMLAVKESSDIHVILLGTDAAEAELNKRQFDKERISFIKTTEVIDTAEHPTVAIREKKDSSMVVGLGMVKKGEADAFVSAGNSGALLVGGQVLAGRIKGVKRSAMAPVIPTQEGNAILIDAGANVDARPEHLVQFAMMGSVYMERVMGIKNPRVAIVNIGAEEEKGNALVKETFPLLSDCKDINFVGNIEARDIPRGGADVIVCEAFVGNVILKMYEGVSSVMLEVIKGAMMSTTRSKIGALLVKPALKKTLKTLTASEYGGAPLLGLSGLIVKAHGNSTRIETMHSLIQCETFYKKDVTKRIKELFSKEDVN